MVHAPLGPPSPGVPAVHSTFRSFHQPWEIDQTRQLAAGTHYVQPMYCTDIVPIKVYTHQNFTSHFINLCAVCMYLVHVLSFLIHVLFLINILFASLFTSDTISFGRNSKNLKLFLHTSFGSLNHVGLVAS